MLRPNLSLAALIALAGLPILSVSPAFADIRTGVTPIMTTKTTTSGTPSKEPTTTTPTSPTIEGGNTISTGGIKSGPFSPVQVCFSNCTSPTSQHQTTTPTIKLSPKVLPLRR